MSGVVLGDAEWEQSMYAGDNLTSPSSGLDTTVKDQPERHRIPELIYVVFILFEASTAERTPAFSEDVTGTDVPQ